MLVAEDGVEKSNGDDKAICLNSSYKYESGV